MSFRQACALFEYWQESPPEHELMAMFAQAYTTWRPSRADRPPTEAEHQASLEQRWKGGVMNARQMFAALGGGAQAVSLGINGTLSGIN